MVYSDTSNKNGIIQRIEFGLGLPDGAITGDTTLFKYVTSLANETLEEVAVALWKAVTDWDVTDNNLTTIPEATTPLTTSRHLLIDSPSSPTINLMKVKRVDITYDGTTWVRANPVDSGEFSFGVGNDDDVDKEFSTEAPAYDVKGNLIAVYPRATSAQVTAGASIRVEFIPAFDLFTTADTTQTPGIDRPFHHLIVLGTEAKFATYRNMSNSERLVRNYEDSVRAMQRYYQDKQQDEKKVFAPLVDSTYYS